MTTLKSASRRAQPDKAKWPAARVLIVDDHVVMRNGLAKLIEEEEGLTVCGEAANSADAMAMIAKMVPDIVLLDISLEGINGIELAKSIRQRFPDLKMLFLSMHDENLYAERALRAGARGYVMKRAAPETLIGAIRKVLDGGMYVSDGVTSRMLRTFGGGTRDDQAKTSIESLSDRELEVFELYGQGLVTREVAARLNISVKTVGTYQDHIKQKLQLANMAELMRRAVSWVENEGGCS